METGQTLAQLGGTLTPDIYQQLTKEQHIGRGTTQAVALPQLIPGFMVGRSTIMGAPQGWDPQGIAARVNVDPDIAGEAFTVDMTKLTSADVERVSRGAQLNQAVSIDDLRNRAAEVYRTLSKPAGSPTNGGEQMQEETRAPLSTPTSPPEQPQQRQSSTYVPSMAPNDTFKQVALEGWREPPQAAPPTPPPAPPPAPAQQPASLFAQVSAPQPRAAVPHSAPRARSQPPTYKVTFEIKDSPMSFEIWYHDVVRNEHVLVLVYDTSCVGYPRTRFKQTESDIAVYVDGSDAIYIAQDPAISFEFDGQEFQILLIKETYPTQRDAAEA